MLTQNGDAGPGVPMGNATNWDNTILSNPSWGYTVNNTPAVGSIAQWDGTYGHVAYVESVGANSITISEDDALTGKFSWRTITTSGDWPDNFLHIKDVTPPSPPDTDGDGVPNSNDTCPTVHGNGSTSGCPSAKSPSNTLTDNDGNPHTYTVDSAGTVYETRWTGAAWTTATLGVTGTDVIDVTAVQLPSGTIHVYSVTSTGIIYETRWNNTTWQTGQVGTVGSGVVAAAVVTTHSDTKPHVYSTKADGRVYETWWDGGTWSTAMVGTGASGTVDVTATVLTGDMIHVYSVTSAGAVYETRWTGTAWVTGQVGTVATGVVATAAIGVGGYARPHVYSVTSTGKLYETRWTGAAWVTGLLSTKGSSVVNVAAVQLSSSLIHVYTVTSAGVIYETRWTGAAWAAGQVGSVGSGVVHFGATSTGQGVRLHVYSGTSAGVIYETRWTGAAWVTNTL